MSVPRTDTEILKRIGRCIASARSAAKLTQAELAEKAGIETVTLSRWETGARSPSVTALVRLAEVLGVDPGDLLTRAPARGPVSEIEEGARLLERMEPERLRLAVRILREVVEP